MATVQERRDSDFISTARDDVRALWEAVYRLKARQAQWTALDYASTLAVATDEGDANYGIERAHLGSAVFDTTDAILALFAAGHGTNLARLL